MILVDTSVIVAWLDRTHADHRACAKALEHWAGQDVQVANRSKGYLRDQFGMSPTLLRRPGRDRWKEVCTSAEF